MAVSETSRPEPTSSRARYDAYRADEIEFYKQVVGYDTLLRLADAAAARMQSRGTLVLGELTMTFEVDDLIAERMRLPSFRAWNRRQGLATAGRQPCSDRAIQLALQIPAAGTGAPVLMLQPRTADLWAAVCADGRSVVVVEPDTEHRERIVELATLSGFGGRVTAIASPEHHAMPREFAAVCYSPAACADLAEWEAEELIESLKTRTVAGGVHVVDGLLSERTSAPRTLLRSSYHGWHRRVQRGTRDWTLVAARPAAA
jgi:hypothetical protein